MLRRPDDAARDDELRIREPVTNDPHLQRGHQLFASGRPDLAEREFRAAIAQDPHDGNAHAFLSHCLAERGDVAGAIEAAERAVALDPQSSFAFLTLSQAQIDGERAKDAEASARQALALDPEDPGCHAAVGGALVVRRRWAEALRYADSGLALDGDHAGCLRLRTLALVQLGRREEAAASGRAALRHSPEDASAHASHGFVLLERGDAHAAIEHFREGLRLEPDNEFARIGLVEALKARNPIYAAFLRATMWLGKQRSGLVIVMVLGAPFVMRALRSFGRDNPSWMPVVIGLHVLYWGVVLMSWFASPLFDLLLRLHPLGRHALDSDQRAGGTAFGVCGAMLVVGGAGWALGWLPGITLGVLGIAVAFPLVGAFGIRKGWARRVAFVLASIVGLAGGTAFGLQATGAASPTLLVDMFEPRNSRDAATNVTEETREVVVNGRPTKAVLRQPKRELESHADNLAVIGIAGAIVVGVLSMWIVMILTAIRPPR